MCLPFARRARGRCLGLQSLEGADLFSSARRAGECRDSKRSSALRAGGGKEGRPPGPEGPGNGRAPFRAKMFELPRKTGHAPQQVLRVDGIGSRAAVEVVASQVGRLVGAAVIERLHQGQHVLRLLRPAVIRRWEPARPDWSTWRQGRFECGRHRHEDQRGDRGSRFLFVDAVRHVTVLVPDVPPDRTKGTWVILAAGVSSSVRYARRVGSCACRPLLGQRL